MMEASGNKEKQSFKNIKLKTVYVEVERLKWNNVMKKSFWKKFRLLRPYNVSLICRQLLNIELQERKRKSISEKENGSSVDKKGTVERKCKGKVFAVDDISAKEPPRKKLKLSDSDSESENLEEKPPDNEYLNLINDHDIEIEDVQAKGNDIAVPKSMKNSAKPPENLLTLYTKSGVKVLSMKSVTVAKSKVSNISSLKDVHKELDLEPLSNNCMLNKEDNTENPCSLDLDNKLDRIIENKKRIEIIREEFLDEDIDNINIKNTEKSETETKALGSCDLNDHTSRQSEDDSSKESVIDVDRNDSDESSTSDNESVIEEDRNECDKEKSANENDIGESDRDSVIEMDENESDKEKSVSEEEGNESDKESIIEMDKNESDKEKSANENDSESDRDSVIEMDKEKSVSAEEGNESDKESIIEIDKSESDKEKSVTEEDRNESNTESIIEMDKHESGDESIIEMGKNESDKASANADDKIDDTESAPEIDPSFDPNKFLTCSIKTDDEEIENKKVPFRKSQNYQLNCDTLVKIKPLLAESITSEFCLKNELKFTSAFRLKKELYNMTFAGQYGYKHHYIHPLENNLIQEDNQETQLFPVADPFTHSIFASIIKRDRKGKDKKANRGFRKFMKDFTNITNPPLNSHTNLLNNGRSFVRHFGSSGQPTVTAPTNALLINSSTIKIGDTFFSRIYDNNKPTQMFRPMNPTTNSVYSPQTMTSRITLSTSNVLSSNISSSNSKRYIYTACNSTGMPVLVPFSQTPSQSLSNDSIPILTAISVANNSQSSNIPPAANSFVRMKTASNTSKPQYINYGDSNAFRPNFPVPFNTYNQQRPVLSYDGKSSTYTPLGNGNFSSPVVRPYPLSTSNLQYNRVHNNFNVPTVFPNNNNHQNTYSSNVAPPLKFGVSRLINHNTIAVQTNPCSKPPQLQQMTSSASSNSGYTVNNVEFNVDVVGNTNMDHHPLPLSSQSSSSANVMSEKKIENNENVSFFQWLHDLKKNGGICGSGCSYGCKTTSFNLYLKYMQLFITNGFSSNFAYVSNTICQLLISQNSYCTYHAYAIMNDPEYLTSLRNLCDVVSNEEYNCRFSGLQLPYISPLLSETFAISNYNTFILKRFVFVVEKVSRIILCPLPANCKFQGNELFDKITVLILMSPKYGLGPGLVIFPHSIMGRNLLLSLGKKGPLFDTWSITAHQKGGLTQSMMTEFLNGECRSWIQSKSVPDEIVNLAIDWWWNLEDQHSDNIYNTFNYISLHKIFPIGKDPIDICINTNMERLWGLLVKAWSNAYNERLQEHHFPQFIYGVFNKLCDPQRLLFWCEESGLHPYNPNICEGFLARVCNLRT